MLSIPHKEILTVNTLLTIVYDCRSDKWIKNCASDFHLSHKLDWSTNINLGTSVGTANGDACMVGDTGTVKLEMKDGSSTKLLDVCTYHNCRKIFSWCIRDQWYSGDDD